MRNIYVYSFLFVTAICFIGLLTYFFLYFKTQQKFLHVVALGDSITVGQRNCQHFDCEFEQNTYVYLFAQSLMNKGIIDYANYAYSGSTAACCGACPSNDIAQTGINAYPNAYVKKVIKLPQNQSVIEGNSNLVNHAASGIVRTKLGEFDTIAHSIVTIAWGRNDEDTPNIGIGKFRNALITIASRIGKNPTNKIIFLTISPLNWLTWDSFPDRRHEFDDRIANQANPVELDAFFSAMVWEAAYAVHASVAPLSEYLRFHPNVRYLATDNVHPTSEGHMIIADILEKNTGSVFRLSLYIASGSAFTIRADVPTYGQIVWEKNNTFYYSQPFFAGRNKPFKTYAKTAITNIFSNRSITVN